MRFLDIYIDEIFLDLESNESLITIDLPRENAFIHLRDWSDWLYDQATISFFTISNRYVFNR